MKLLLQEKEKNPKLKFAKMVKVGIVVFLAVFFLEIWMVNRLSTYGYKIEELQKIKAELILENQVMENEIAQVSALAPIESKAVQLGFVPIKNIDYLKPVHLASAK